MTTIKLARVALAALIGAALTGAAHADIKNYEFQLAQPTVKTGADRVVTVRLVDKSSGKAIPDAVIFAIRLDMAPRRYAGDGHQGDGHAGHRTRDLPLQGQFQHGRALAALARRQGAG